MALNDPLSQLLEEDCSLEDTGCSPIQNCKLIPNIKQLAKQSQQSHQTSNKEPIKQIIVNYQISGNFPPWDWTLKNEVIIQSECSLRNEFLQLRNRNFLLEQGLLNFRFQLAQQDIGKSRSEAANENLLGWFSALQDLQNLMECGKCSAYYILPPQGCKTSGMVVIFVSWGVIMTQSSREIRDYLQKMEVEFQLPLINDKNQQIQDFSTQSLIFATGCYAKRAVNNYFQSNLPTQIFGQNINFCSIIAPIQFENSTMFKFPVQFQKNSEQNSIIIKGGQIAPWNIFGITEGIKQLIQNQNIKKFSVRLLSDNQLRQGFKLFQKTGFLQKQQFQFSELINQNEKLVFGVIKEIIYENDSYKFSEWD